MESTGSTKTRLHNPSPSTNTNQIILLLPLINIHNHTHRLHNTLLPLHQKPTHDRIKIRPAQSIIPRTPHNIHKPIQPHPQQTHIQRPTSKIINQHVLHPLLLVQSVRQRRCRGLFQHPLHLNSREGVRFQRRDSLLH
mmetsp:Transcript_29652/g.36089  ORF Transcript_29652/g.36089 Transcript_29652/m.36089 type:complete len:138 (-) Transcript_29652:825-1238(-)